MLACHLSGGVDSTAVVALARQYTAPRAFTLSFGVDGYDERPLAEATARALGVPLEVIGVDGPTLVETLPEAVARTEGLGINGHLPAKFLLSRAIRGAGLRVCLSGEGADEALLGYPHLRQDLLRAAGAPREHEARLEAANRAAIGVMLADGTQLPTDAVAARLGFVPSWLAAKAALGARTRPLLAEALRHEQRAADPILALVEACAPSGADHPVERASDLWTQTALPRYILSTLGDGAELAYGVEGRVPFLDHPLFAFARGLPLDFKIRSGVEKWVLREALRGLVPDDVVRRPKHPLLAPPLVTTALEPLRELALSSTSALFDRARIERLFDHVAQLPPAERGPWDPPLVMAASASCLEQALGLSEGA
jgi:asparagine synthase (glutamine-hydrolysing)